jgi:hypothetical protein
MAEKPVEVNLVVESARIDVEHGYMELKAAQVDDSVTYVRVSFEALEQFYEKVRSHLYLRRALGLKEGEVQKDIPEYPFEKKPLSNCGPVCVICGKPGIHAHKTEQPKTCGECVHFEGNEQKDYCPFKMTETMAESGGCGEGEKK